jgi:hypothetical protein
MASRKAGDEREEFQPRINIPAQEEEADILEEAGAEEDEETGELMADEDKVRKLGAADPATVREDRRLRSIANKKRQGKKNIGFGTNDPLVVYETILKAWEPDSIDITVKRLTGAQVVQVVRSRPRSRTELYKVIETVHGQHEEAEYDIRFHDSSGHQWRGQGRITMPDTRPQGHPHGNGHYPQPQQPTAPGAPSVVVQAPPGQDMGTMFSSFQAMFDMFQNIQQRMAPQQYAQPQMPIMPPQPPPTASPAEQMAWMQQVFDMFQRMQGTARGAPQQPQMHAPQGPNVPNTPPPPGYVYRWLPEANCCVLEPVNRPAPMMSRDQRERPPYYATRREPHDQRDPYARDPYARPNQGPPDPLRESMSTVRRAMALREELDSLFGGGGQRGDVGGHLDAAPGQDPDSPIEVVRTDNGDIVYDRQDGNIRGWDTLLVNLPSMLKKGGEFVDKISKTAAAERQRRERVEQQQLPPGYVRLTEGYEPPEGLVAVPVNQTPPRAREQDLPPPPAHVPPPIEDEPAPPPQQRGWDEDFS